LTILTNPKRAAQMEFQKVFIREDGNINIRCPACMTEKVISSKMLSGKHKFKAKCACGSVFGVQCESRKKFRKQVDLGGIILRPDYGKRWGRTLSESEVTRIKPINCKVRNISMEGIGLTLVQDVQINEGDFIMVRFTLDNTALTEMEKKCIVRANSNSYIGCEFFDSDKNDTKLGFYLL
jgi:hypothetical protein